ncbi:YncE family protein [Algivirga pacifica]|uniref:40-residue YVTN family beta-propeller repeat-containing protein n=1 Tax=Algivirga pacifica TaxID=1162670 RepID=A0ABP9CZB5_9BACT
MKNFKLLLLITSFAVFFASCDDDNNSPAPEVTLEGTLLINAGGFGQANGSLSLYDESTGTLDSKVFSAANGRELAASIESVTVQDTMTLIMCYAPDKVEFAHTSTLKSLNTPTTDVVNPRYASIHGDYAYVTCWGPYEADFSLQNSYVAKIDLRTFEKVDEIPVGSGPEGIITIDDQIFVAVSNTQEIAVIDPATAEVIKTIPLEVAPQHLSSDNQGTLWCTLSSYSANSTGLQAIDLNELTATDFYALEAGINYEGHLSTDESGNTLYVLGNDGGVYSFDTEAKTYSTSSIIAADPSIYGFGVNPMTAFIYTSDAAGFQGNGSIKVYDETGTLTDEEVVGVAPFRFVF